MQPTETEILAANEAFYQAFARRDIVVMDALWARRAPVACIHPGWGVLRGRAEVMASWRGILENPTPQPITCSGPDVFVLGEAAFVVCTESVDGSALIATNVFVREDGAWRLVHHQAGPVAQREAPPRRVPGRHLN